MAKVILGMAMSLDGFVNDPTGSVQPLYPDFAGMIASEMLQEAIRNTGAVVMGRQAYDMANGDFTGYEFQTPIFVVTHHPPAQTAKGENDNLKFNFVTGGVGQAVAQARAAAGQKDVVIVGGANIAQQALNLGLVDELDVDVVPVLLGGGLRFFDHLVRRIELESLKTVAMPAVTHLHFRVVK